MEKPCKYTPPSRGEIDALNRLLTEVNADQSVIDYLNNAHLTAMLKNVPIETVLGKQTRGNGHHSENQINY